MRTSHGLLSLYAFCSLLLLRLSFVAGSDPSTSTSQPSSSHAVQRATSNRRNDNIMPSQVRSYHRYEALRHLRQGGQGAYKAIKKGIQASFTSIFTGCVSYGTPVAGVPHGIHNARSGCAACTNTSHFRPHPPRSSHSASTSTSTPPIPNHMSRTPSPPRLVDWEVKVDTYMAEAAEDGLHGIDHAAAAAHTGHDVHHVEWRKGIEAIRNREPINAFHAFKNSRTALKEGMAGCTTISLFACAHYHKNVAKAIFEKPTPENVFHQKIQHIRQNRQQAYQHFDRQIQAIDRQSSTSIPSPSQRTPTPTSPHPQTISTPPAPNHMSRSPSPPRSVDWEDRFHTYMDEAVAHIEHGIHHAGTAARTGHNVHHAEWKKGVEALKNGEPLKAFHAFGNSRTALKEGMVGCTGISCYAYKHFATNWGKAATAICRKPPTEEAFHRNMQEIRQQRQQAYQHFVGQTQAIDRYSGDDKV
ncbi:uncharacterized protein FA14DRAFT_176951 [Meira miltonrushii]|uniref:Uncharacterized protein n=1 Tax=Meira miltonrushii TaxID=1280837 RepID=A0A316VKA9_9BASI|nr:uncharacterized protein FA14DRAFT_176951 [Meira miltonrushii]PWN37664.1 hypothetical protein FA14DRAFT_176951 [Meira miltonrushii]